MGIDRRVIRELLERAWQPEGFCVPNASVYPFQWLWDSCFHVVVWTELGDDRALTELQSALAQQDPETGFVPHLVYWSEPEHHAEFWGRRLTSSITQPPMYAHALARLVDAERVVPPELFAKARAGLANLLGRRRAEEALVPVFHPWETGCDDSPRWDAWGPATAPPGALGPGALGPGALGPGALGPGALGPGALGPGAFDPGAFDPGEWKRVKGELVEALRVDVNGFVVGSNRFCVASVGFNALVAWNIAELARVGEADDFLAAGASEIVAGLRARWDPALATWTDDTATGSVRTADAMLPLLVDPRPEAFESLGDPVGFAGPFGIRGVHQEEPSYDPDTYWRGPSWPQLDYLLLRALTQAGLHDEAARLGQACADGARRSGWAEYWNAENGMGGGAAPQTWTGLALVMPHP